MGNLLCDAYRRECFRTIAGPARSRTMRTPVNAYDTEYVTQGRTSLPWSDNHKSLLERLQELYRMAIVGWGSDQLRTAFQRDLSDFVFDQEQQHRYWQQLQESWQRFLDDLFKELDRR